MSRKLTIECDLTKLRVELPTIRQSQVQSFKNLIRKAMMRARKLVKDDTPEVWKLALGEITFHDAIKSFVARLPDESQLRSALRRLEIVAKRGPMTMSDVDKASDPTDRFLVQHWIWGGAQERSGGVESSPASPVERLLQAGNEHFAITDKFLQGSLCLYSDKAMAKIQFYRKNSAFPHPDQIGAQAQALRQRYHRLGLVPAHKRIFRDTAGSKTLLLFIPFTERLAKS